MSLTRQLHDGELAEWCQSRFPGTRAVAESVVAAAGRHRLAGASGQLQDEHWAAIGSALGVRLALGVQHAPPYHALYGLVRAGLATRAWAEAAAAVWPTHRGLPASRRASALEQRPTPAGWWDLGEPGDPEPVRDHEPALDEFFARTLAYVEEHAPPGQLGAGGVEADLLRACWVLAALEDVYRGTRVDSGLRELVGRGAYTVADLAGLAPDPAVAELVALVEQARLSGAWAQMRQLAGDPAPGQALGTAAPVLVPHWAVGDLLLGGTTPTALTTSAGSSDTTLVDVRTVTHADTPDDTGRWLWELLASAWLDVPDRWRIRRVGLYLTRHGVLLTWPVARFAEALTEGRRTGSPRREFVKLARRVLAGEGAHLR